jgi:hypothetical protein
MQSLERLLGRHQALQDTNRRYRWETNNGRLRVVVQREADQLVAAAEEVAEAAGAEMAVGERQGGEVSQTAGE